MIARLTCGFCAVALLAGAAAAGESPSKGPAKMDPDKIVCRVTQDTGSRLGKTRVCRTNAQWAEMRRQTQEAVDHIQNSRAASGN